MFALVMAVLILQASPRPVLENEFVKVFKNDAPCATAAPSCGERIVVALGPLELGGKRMSRGDFKVFGRSERYTPPAVGDYFEVVLKTKRPKVKTPSVSIPPDKNSLLYDGATLFIYEEKLQPGDTRTRHSHNGRVGIMLNETRLQQWPDGQPEFFRDTISNDIQWFEPVVHVVKNVGTNPLRNFVIELKP